MICIDEYEAFAKNRLPKYVFDYYRSGADEEITLKENRDAYKRLYLRPRLLRNVSLRNLETSVQGHNIAFPIGIAPTAMQCMAHPDGEKATARAASSMGTLMILSTLSTTSLEDVAISRDQNSILWFQLYIYKDRNITKQIIQRAEKSGFKAIVITADAPLFGKRRADEINKFSLPSHLRLANFDVDDKKSSGVRQPHSGSGINKYVTSLFDQSISWDDVAWVKNITTLPLIVKGILTPEDALLAHKYGADGVIVSNHGARQVDSVPATIEVLPEITKALTGSNCEVYMDGGIRTGTDVLKALALGARTVFIGRPIVWGLAFNGQEGVEHVLQLLKSELELAMALCGCSCVKDIKPELVVRKNFYSCL